MKIVTGRQMQAIDRRAIEEFGIPSLTLMENAGRGVAAIIATPHAALSPFWGEGKGEGKVKPSILVFCGKGNNGGDGLVAARYLAECGFPVQVILFCDPSELKKDPAINFKKLSGLNIPIHVVRHSEERSDEESKRKILRSAQDDDTYREFLKQAGLVVDALFGVGIKEALTEPFLSAVIAINDSKKKVLAVDIPSGLDADTGVVLGAAVKAAVTATLQFPKKGLYEGEGPRYAGSIEVIDIGIPKECL